MSFWKKAEMELLLALSSDDPNTVSAYTNWSFYASRLERCEGFAAQEDWRPEGGGRLLRGEIDIREFNYIWLRKHMGSDAAESRFWAERAKLASGDDEVAAFEPIRSLAKIGPGEKETVIHAEMINPYWLKITTDMAHWSRRLDEHPYAVPVAEVLYADDSRQASFLLPRKLLTIRSRRPQLSEEQKDRLRERIGVSADAPS